MTASQGSRESAATLFCCPSCGAALQSADRAVRCERGHSFDIASEGYVNLLLAQHRRSKDPGYSREMIAGRRAFLAAGHYQLLADSIADLILQYLDQTHGQTVLDAGCGEGYYLRRLRNSITAQRPDMEPILAGLDISKHGIRAAAKADPLGLYAVASTHRMPVLPERVAVLVTHFSPVSADDFRRVVCPGGVVLVGSPGPEHLFALKELLYDVPARHESDPALTREPGFELLTTGRIRYSIDLQGPSEVSNLLLMTPYFWSASRQDQARLGEVQELETEVDVMVHAFRRAL